MQDNDPSRATIRTSESDWLKKLAKLYEARRDGTFVDDAGLGIDPTSQSLLDMARRGGLSTTEIVAVALACGMSAAGVWMVVAALADPEPTSKLGLLVAGGLLLAVTGGHSALQVLTNRKPPCVTLTGAGVKLSW